jgi:phosphate:Na+ symporter
VDSGLLIEIIFQALGGLGVFLLGMKNMSEGVQAIAGPKLRQMIDMATSNRFVAVGMGTFVTCLVQSSSITTVIVVGLVNVNVMNLTQAFGVIMGANIGTTITGWILVLKIGKYGLPILGGAALAYLFTKRERIRYFAMAIMGLGMVFFGLELMKNGFAPLKEMPEFEKWFSAFSPQTYFGVLKCALVGAVLTAVVQSSSATLGITIGLATTGVIDFPTAAALVLGENIGTTVTAFLASIGGSVNARRASYSHILFNLVGVAWITAIFSVYLRIVIALVERIYGGDPTTMLLVDDVETFPYITAGIALTHSIFNVINVLLFLPLMSPIAAGLERLVPDKATKTPAHLSYFDIGLVSTPALAIQQSQKEILSMGVGVRKMLDEVRPLLKNPESNVEAEKRIFHREEVLDIVQKEISEFLSEILHDNVSHDVIDEATSQMRVADEYESISDYIVTLLKLSIRLRKEEMGLSKMEIEEILKLHDQVSEYVNMMNDAVIERRGSVLSKARTQGDNVTHVVREFRSNHLERLGRGECKPLESLAYTDMLNAYRRIKDHALNIAEVLGGDK